MKIQQENTIFDYFLIICKNSKSYQQNITSSSRVCLQRPFIYLQPRCFSASFDSPAHPLWCNFLPFWCPFALFNTEILYLQVTPSWNDETCFRTLRSFGFGSRATFNNAIHKKVLDIAIKYNKYLLLLFIDFLVINRLNHILWNCENI